MTNTQTTTPTPADVARPKTLSLYPYQINWLITKASENNQKRKEANPSKVVQEMIDRAIKAEKKGK